MDPEKVGFELFNSNHFFVLMNIELVGRDDFPVILEPFVSRGFFAVGNQRHTANLEQFRRRKEDHLSREVQNGVRDATLFQHGVLQLMLFRFNRARQPRRARAYDDNVEGGS